VRPGYHQLRHISPASSMTPHCTRPPSLAPRGAARIPQLGLTSFGGPIAHIGYFREEFVVRRGWLDEPAFSDLVALGQFLPGPASSQVGFSIGLMRAGYLEHLRPGPASHYRPRSRSWRSRMARPHCAAGGVGVAARAETRGGRDRRTSRVGDGALSVPRQTARHHCGLRGADRPIRRLVVRPNCCDLLRRHSRVVVLS